MSASAIWNFVFSSNHPLNLKIFVHTKGWTKVLKGTETSCATPNRPWEESWRFETRHVDGNYRAFVHNHAKWMVSTRDWKGRYVTYDPPRRHVTQVLSLAWTPSAHHSHSNVCNTGHIHHASVKACNRLGRNASYMNRWFESLDGWNIHFIEKYIEGNEK